MLPNVKQSSQEAIDFMEKTKIAKLCLVVPCYNEESILRDSAHKMAEKLTELKELNIIDRYSSVLLVNDGSQDQTWKIISQLHQEAPQTFMGLKLSANRGHQNALLAGLLEARQLADVTISLDADLQDDLDAINEFMSEYYRGSDIVYGVRSDRSSDSFLKRCTAESFYKFMHHLGVKTIYNHADFRLMSRRALDALAQYKEVNLYLRGLIPLLGYRQSIVLYQRKSTDRPTHYTLGKMLLLAWDGITSFSVRPIRLISILGGVALFWMLILILKVLYDKFFGNTVAGWTSLSIIVLLFSGMQLLAIGVIGEDIAKTYMEVKRRPRFNIEEKLTGEENEEN